MMPLEGMSIEKPAAPLNLIITRKTGTSLRISWDPSVDDYHNTYKIYRSTDNFVADETLIKTTTAISHSDLDLAVGTWYYRISDMDIHEIESDPSTTISYIMKALLPFTDTFAATTGTGIVTKDINDSLGRNATSGTVLNNGPAVVTVELSYDGITFPESFDMLQYDLFDLVGQDNKISIDSIKFTSTDASITIGVT